MARRAKTAAQGEINDPGSQLEPIERAMGLRKPNLMLRAVVRMYVKRYYGVHWSNPTHRDPRPKFLRQWIVKIRRDVESLLGDLRFSDKPLRVLDDKELAQVVVIYKLMAVEVAERKLLISKLKELIEAVEVAEEGVPKDRGGKLFDWRFHGLIVSLAGAYKMATKKKAAVSRSPYNGVYGGPFFRFVETVLTQFVPRVKKTNSALGKAIQRSLKSKVIPA